jgi:hypothetical protein
VDYRRLRKLNFEQKNNKIYLREDIMNKKILSVVVLILFSTFSFAITVYADRWSPTEDWGPQVGSYSPDWGRTVMYEYNDSAYNLYVSPQARFRFTEDAIKSIRSYYYLYYTFDISVSDQYNTTVSALNTTMYYSTLTSPHFDRDDDPEESGGNGYFDETEVTCTSPLDMCANIDYRFDSRFRVYFTDPITFEFASQMSHYNYYTGEYDTWYYDIHKTRNYPWY